MLLAAVSMGSVSAYEVVSGKRWRHMSFVNGTWRCNLVLNTTQLSGLWAQEVDRAISNWNNYSDGKMHLFRSSNPYGGTVWLKNISKNDWSYGKGATAITQWVDKDGHTYMGRPGENATYGFGDRIDSANIYFNDGYRSGLSGGQYGSDYLVVAQRNRAKTITHELGHCVNLGHNQAQSVMNTGWDKSWANYDRPTAYDRADLKNYYSKSYK